MSSTPEAEKFEEWWCVTHEVAQTLAYTCDEDVDSCLFELMDNRPED